MTSNNNSPWAKGAEMEEKRLGKEAQAKMLIEVFGAGIIEAFSPPVPNKNSPWATENIPEQPTKNETQKKNPQVTPSPWGL